MISKNNVLPLIYSCSGCSNNAQLANQVALDMDRECTAEMSCIVGVGGNVPSIVKKAKSGRQIIALDGCHLHCVKGCLEQHEITPTVHYTLTKFGIKKKYKKDFEGDDVELVKTLLLNHLKTIPNG
ncbi:MAG: zinc-binding protein [Oceanospirillaceae bacterium]|jgi:uncharacterized metal-binding protein|nr:zinc-binding protein [Oceanospirillaceae bacterium]